MSTKRVVVLAAVVLCGAGMVMGQTEWVDDPSNPIIGPGAPGTWEATGHWVRAAVFDGTTYHLWFTGSNDLGVPTDMGHATSSDGVIWTMDPANPVMTRGEPGTWDDSRLDGAAVVHDGTTFHMWYSAWGPDNFERAGYATSPDGTIWTKHPGNPVMDVGPPGSWDEDIVRPTSVIFKNGLYNMWYGGGDWAGTELHAAVGHAESRDGINWKKDPDPVLQPSTYPGAWDMLEASNPYVVFDGTLYHMWYTGGIETSSTVDLSIGYAYSSDGLVWTKHRGNPVLSSEDTVLFHSPVVHDGTAWRMWYSSWDGSIDLIHTATSDCCPGVPDLDNWQFIPAAAVAAGAQGAFFQTDVDVSNADSQEAEYQFMWFPRGVDNSEHATSETFTLGAGKSARYNNVLTEVFDLEPDSLGALGIKAETPDLLAMSRTYNTPSGEEAGTFGQAIPAIRQEDFIQHGERRRILFGSENADMRTNIGCQNGGTSTAAVFFELSSADGTSLGRPFEVLNPLGNVQLNRIFDGHNPVDGYVDVWTATAGGLFYCYGSVLDNVTSDPTTILPL